MPVSDLAVVASEKTGHVVGGESDSESALVLAFNQVRGPLVNTLFFLLRNHDDAQDAVQDAFLKCWRARGSLPQIRNMRAWIFRVGLNAAKDLQRSSWRRRSRPMTAEISRTTLGEDLVVLALEEQEDLERLRQALLHLRPEGKAVFLLRQNGHLTYKEIAQLLQSPVGSVKTLMRAALRTLRQVLQEK
jgi:RNA polymerase sigma-70 factor (ECF subfamily)